MTNLSPTFTDFETLKKHIENQKKGFLSLPFQNCTEYAGMVFDMGIIFDTHKNSYQLDLQWISFGLDLFGENLLENYLYEFESLEKLLTYLLEKYNIHVHNIPINYKFNPDLYPNPLKNEIEKPLFETAWKQFQLDFKKGIFLDTSLKLVYSTQDL